MSELHFVIDAYDVKETQGDSLMLINELLVRLSAKFNLKPVMPPYLLPYYSSKDYEDSGISAFCILANGHITIHTFPRRSCYFADVLTDIFIEEDELRDTFKEYLYADRMSVDVIDRRFPGMVEGKKINENADFGPHYLIETQGFEMTMDSIYRWLDDAPANINMLPITRPYVIYDSRENPSQITGVVMVAQSHIAVHYDIKTMRCRIDIFSCSFLRDEQIASFLKKSFGDKFTCQLFARGSKYISKKMSKESRLTMYSAWRNFSK